MRVVGLTGGVATGKSTVARQLSAEHGVVVIDADQVARQVVEPGQPTLRQLVHAFGPSILTNEGELDRPAMRALITADPRARATLNGIIHPAIGVAIAGHLAALREQGVAVAVVEAALMVESGSYQMYDALMVVTTTPEVQLARLVVRDGQSEDAARKFIATQMPLKEKEAVADVVVVNDADLETLHARVADAWCEIIALLSTNQ